MVTRATAACDRFEWPRGRRTRGFTMIELLMVITVIAILAAVGMPAFNGMVLNSRIRTATFDMYSSLTFARSEAIKRNTQVDVVPAAIGGWVNGWTVQFGIAPATVLRSQDPIPSITFAGPIGMLSYRQDGRLAAAPAVPTFSLSVPGNSQVNKRCVNVGVSGQPNIQVDNNRDGICANG